MKFCREHSASSVQSFSFYRNGEFIDRTTRIPYTSKGLRTCFLFEDLMQELIPSAKVDAVIVKLAQNIRGREIDFSKVALVGIHTRGVPLAERLYRFFHDHDLPLQLGKLDINLYRDDLSESAEQPILKSTEIPFDVTGKTVYLCDDVLYTGRTIRAAMDAVFDLGRPKKVHLVVLARRTGRELPIDTEFYGIDVKTVDGDNIKVKFREIDGQDSVTLLKPGEY